MLGMQINERIDVNLVCILLKCALSCIDFKSPALTREKECLSRDLTPKDISDLFPKICMICANSGFIIDSPKVINQGLAFTPDDWSVYVKYCFSQAAIAEPKTFKILKSFSTKVYDMLKDSNLPEQIDMSPAFKQLIRQLVVEKIEAAEAIHLMIQFAHNVIINKEENGTNDKGVASTLSIVFYRGLELDFPQDKDDHQTDLFQTRKAMNNFRLLTLGLQLLFTDKFFANPFSADLYISHQQNYDIQNKSPFNLQALSGSLPHLPSSAPASNKKHRFSFHYRHYKIDKNRLHVSEASKFPTPEINEPQDNEGSTDNDIIESKYNKTNPITIKYNSPPLPPLNSKFPTNEKNKLRTSRKNNPDKAAKSEEFSHNHEKKQHFFNPLISTTGTSPSRPKK